MRTCEQRTTRHKNIIPGNRVLSYPRSGGWRLQPFSSLEQVFSDQGLYRPVPENERHCWVICCRPCPRRGFLRGRVYSTGDLPINRYHDWTYRYYGAHCCLQTSWAWLALSIEFSLKEGFGPKYTTALVSSTRRSGVFTGPTHINCYMQREGKKATRGYGKSPQIFC